MNIKRIVIFYKRSAYSIYFNRRGSSFAKNAKLTSDEIKRFLKMHDTHHRSLQVVESIVRTCRLPYKKVCRGQRFVVQDSDLIVTVGGDGTFLEAARMLKDQPILGVNSDPSWSVGRFCCATADNLSAVLSKLFDYQDNISQFPRLEIAATQNRFNVLNDVLFAHANPAAMSRYALTIGAKREEQKSSGVWVSTAAGSSGAIKSAGGKVFAPSKRIMQYKPRELYVMPGKTYRLTGGILRSGEITMTSMMREGCAFLDGSHVSLPVGFGESVRISFSSHPLNVVLAS